VSPQLLLIFFLGYTAILISVTWMTSRKANNDSFFIGNKNSYWFLVAFGMVGTSLSGVTFVSVPGTVGTGGLGYYQVVIGYFIGYFAVAFILLPLYYKLNLTSIYNYLSQRFGTVAHKTGSLFFIISRTLGATARLYLVINVLQIFILDRMGVPFIVTLAIILLLILLYTFNGGVKTIVWTDTLQTSFMLSGLFVCVIYIFRELGLDLGNTIHLMKGNHLLSMFNTDVKSSGFFLKQIFGGAFITIAMTGLDQEMMQKNISVKRLADSQKNMLSYSTVMLVVNLIFLLLGGLLYLYAASKGIKTSGDDLFPTIAVYYFPPVISIIFIIALISALFPSADGALTALTSSFCIDIIDIRNRSFKNEKNRIKLRKGIHLIFAFLFMLCVMGFKLIDNKSIIDIILKVAGYTYGPLLGLFAFGVLTKRQLNNNLLIAMVCLLSPVISFLISSFSKKLFFGYEFGYELLIFNGLITFFCLFLLSVKSNNKYQIKDDKHQV